MLPFVVVGSGLCAAVIATDLATTFPVRWYMPGTLDVALTAPLPSLLVPTGTTWPHAGAESSRRIRRFAQWSARQGAPAPTPLPVMVAPSAQVEFSGLTLGALDAATLWDTLIQRAHTLNVAPITTLRTDVQRENNMVTGIATDDGVQTARAVILAEGIEPVTIHQLPTDAGVLRGHVLIHPRTALHPAQWSYVFPWQQQVYLAGRPDPVLDGVLGGPSADGTATWGIGVRGDDSFQARRRADGLIEVAAIGSGGLLGLPLITKQVLTVLGISLKH